MYRFNANNHEDNDLVICSLNGKPINPSNLLRSFHNLCDKFHFPKIRFHDLRHTHPVGGDGLRSLSIHN